MSQLYKLLIGIVLILFLGVSHSVAQTTSISISHPVHGKLVFTGNIRGGVSGDDNKQLLLADTSSGNIQNLSQHDILLHAPVWNSDGDQIAYENGRILNLFNLSNNTQMELTDSVSLTEPQDFSPDNTHLLYISYISPRTPPERYELGIIDLNSGSSVILYSYPVHDVIDNVPLPQLPEGVATVKLSEIRQAAWNPVYPDWIVVQLEGYSKEVESDQGYPVGVSITFAQNLETGERLLLDTALAPESRISGSPITWSPDGKYLVLQTDIPRNYVDILNFANRNGNWSFSVIDSAPSQDHAVLDWFGAGDLLLTATRDNTTGDSVRYITQIIDGTWHSTEFFRLPQSTFERTGGSDWYITASDTEKQTLTCLFDQAQPSQLSVGTRARVNFTNGTPLRLRTMPSQDGTVILQMPEGTAFDVIGGSACINADSYYRFWQLRLDDGTIGWAAEADQSNYFIEPLVASTLSANDS